MAVTTLQEVHQLMGRFGEHPRCFDEQTLQHYIRHGMTASEIVVHIVLSHPMPKALVERLRSQSA